MVPTFYNIAKVFVQSRTIVYSTYVPLPSLIILLAWTFIHQVAMMHNLKISPRGGALEDVLGLGDVLEDTFCSPWPRSLKSSKIALSSARGHHYFWTAEILLENARNLAENLQRPFFLVSSSRDRLKKFLKTFFFWKKFLKTFFFEIARNKNLKTFFFLDNLRLLPWSLASRGSLLGLEIFLSPWPWPQALCPRLHLWYCNIWYKTKPNQTIVHVNICFHYWYTSCKAIWITSKVQKHLTVCGYTGLHFILFTILTLNFELVISTSALVGRMWRTRHVLLVEELAVIVSSISVCWVSSL